MKELVKAKKKIIDSGTTWHGEDMNNQLASQKKQMKSKFLALYSNQKFASEAVGSTFDEIKDTLGNIQH